MSKIKILLVDDNPEFLNLIQLFIEDFPDLEFVGSASSGLEAVEKVKTLRPHVVLIDISMPRMNGVETTRQIKKLPDAPYVFMLSAHDTPMYRAAAQKAHAEGYFNKQQFGSETIKSIIRLFSRGRVE